MRSRAKRLFTETARDDDALHTHADRPPARRTDWAFWGLVALLLVAASLRLYAVQIAPLWLDEFWSQELSCGRDTAHEHLPVDTLIDHGPALTSLEHAAPWWRVWTSMREEPHPPTFFVILRWFRDVLGPSDTAARMLPFVMSLCAIVLMYLAVRELHGPGPGMWAAALTALSAQQVTFAVELRNYSTIMSITAAACAVVAVIEKRGPSWGRITLLGALSLLAVMTHYFTIGLLVGLAIYVLIRLPRAVARRAIVAFAVAAAVFLLVWGRVFLAQRGAFQLERSGATFLIERGPGHFAQTLYRLMRIPAAELGPTVYPAPLAWLVYCAWWVPLIWIRRRPELLLWYLVAVGSCSVLLLLDLTRSSRHLAFDRYIFIASPGVIGIFAAGGWHWKGGWRHVPPAIAAIVCVLLLRPAYAELQNRIDWQVVATLVSQNANPGDPILFAAGPDDARQMYLDVQNYLPVAEHPVAILTAPAGASLARQLRAKGKACWIISPHNLDEAGRYVPGASIRLIGLPVQGRILVGEVTWRAVEKSMPIRPSL